MYQAIDGVLIEAISSCVPKNLIRNDHFADLLESKELRMFEKTVGILERRWADREVTSSDLGFKAATRLFNEYHFKRQDIKCVVFLSQTPDFIIPFTSNVLQDKLGLPRETLCLDINAGCAGFIQGLSTAFSIARTISGNGKILFVVAETLSKILSPKDRGTSMLFGDAASALIISSDSKLDNKTFFNFFSDGSNCSAIQIQDGGFRNGIHPNSATITERENGNFRSNLNLSMDGPKVFDFTLREVAPSIEALLENYSLDKGDIDFFLFHQSNRFIIRQILAKLGIPNDRTLINIERFGNTSGVSLPLLLTTHRELFNSSRRVLLTGYGSGLNWGTCVMDIDKRTIISELIEY